MPSSEFQQRQRQPTEPDHYGVILLEEQTCQVHEHLERLEFAGHHEEFDQEVCCHDATTHEMDVRQGAHHDPSLFDTASIQVVSYDVDGPRRERWSHFVYNCCKQCDHGVTGTYCVFKK